jgi:dTDP-glucose pyrophosphorylase
MRTRDLPVVELSGTLLDALRIMDASGLEIVLVVSGPRLVGVLTDGDARRGLIRGRPLDCPVGELMQRDFRWVEPDVGRAEVLDLMKALRIKQIPVLDTERNLRGLHLLNDIIGAKLRPNRALILCGGLGTRLRPITETVPKPMISVAGRPILERLVLHLVGHGFRSIHLAIHYLGEQIRAHFGNGARFGCTIQYIEEAKPLGTGGAFGLLPNDVNEPVLVMNGDLVTQFDVGRLIDHHEFHGNDATVGVKSYSHQVPFGVVEGRDQVVVSLKEKPILDCTINAGIYALNPALRRYAPPGRPTTLPAIIEACLRDSGRVGMLHIDEEWIDVGRREELDRAQGGGPHSAELGVHHARASH